MNTDATSPRDARLLEKLLREKYEPIAIVGVGVRFPGGNDTPAAFAESLKAGRAGTGPVPADRWDVAALYSPEDGARGRIRTQGGGFLSGIDQFDARFFNIAPKEANVIDPQHRLVLECAWSALEHANIDPLSLKDADGGVYIGIACVDYTIEVESLRWDELDAHVGTGTSHSSAAGRLSFFLGLRGPCIALDTACSSSLVSAHLAIQGLRRGECSIALAGGVNLVHHPRHHIVFSQANMLARDGRCKTFDAAADGYGRSEGCGILVLKRLSDAIADGNEVIALLRGSAIAQDGASAGLTVPNGQAQEMVMRRALESALLAPKDVQVVEAHGTGTPLGDPIEMGAIHAVFAESHDAARPVVVGSVKTNLGHMEAAAGVGGIVKAALQLRHGEIYPHLNLTQPSPQIPWDRYAVEIPRQGRPWTGAGRRVLVNSFGFSGIIAAVLVEQSPRPAAPMSADDGSPQLFALSARSRSALATLARAHRDRLADPAHAGQSLRDLCRACGIGRAHFAHRIAKVVRNRAELGAFLQASVQALEADGAAETAARQPPRVAFLCTGQGAQWVGMGRAADRRFPAFREALAQCDALFAPHLGVSIRSLMFGEAADAAEQLGRTAYTQPALFAIEWAMARLWQSFGVEPVALIGHSIGELVAATLAGVFTLEDAVRIVAERGRLMQSVRREGGMLAVSATPDKVAPLLQGMDDVAFAAFNAPSQCVVSGGADSLRTIAGELQRLGIAAKPLPVSHAFHSPLMAQVYPAFRAAFDGIALGEPTKTLISNATGAAADPAAVRDPDYWVRHIGEPVRYVAGIQSLAARGRHAFIEVGPTGTLCALGRASVDAREHLWLPSIQADEEHDGRLLESLAQAYLAGLAIDWRAVYRGTPGPRLDLPGYPFERKRHWLPVAQRHAQLATAASVGHPLLGTAVVAGREYLQKLSAARPAYLADHLVMGQVIFPGAGYVELLLALQDEVYGESAREIAELKIHEALVLREDATTLLRTVLAPLADGGAEVRITSRLEGLQAAAGDSGERLHATARIAAAPAGGLAELAAAIHAAAGAAGSPVRRRPADDVYADYRTIGLPYGPQFRRLSALDIHADGLAVGQLAPPTADEAPGELLPPRLADAAFQAVAGLLEPGRAYLPVRFERLQLLKKPREALRSIVRASTPAAASEDELHVDVLITEDTRPVFVVHALVLKRVAGAVRAARRLHEPVWRQRSLVQGNAVPRKVAVIGHAALPHPVVETIPCAGVDALIERLQADPAIGDVAWFWRSGPAGTGLDALREECRRHIGELLDLTKALGKLAHERRIKLWLVSEGQHQGGGEMLVGPAAATLWGVGAVLQNEMPKLRTTLVDLPPGDVSGLLEEWSYGEAGGSENRIAWRGGARHVRRIVPLREPAAGNFRVAIREYGLLSNLGLEAIAEPAAPGDEEIQVEIAAAGLNFKDVLNALGMLKQHAEQQGQAYTPLPLGFEGAGTVVAAGARSGFAVGDPVIVNHSGCMQRRITVPAMAAVRRPAALTPAQAAGVATAFVTAAYALHDLAAMKAGDIVLIHAAAGGVGQAAVQLARRAGATVFATASPRKWALLKRQGVEHVLNSRTLDFADEIRRRTGGRGVDIVLNSLNKDFIPASLSALGDGGRFVELGKVGIWSAAQMQAARPDVAYYNFDLGEFPVSELLAINRRILEDVCGAMDAGELAPPPCTAYAKEELEEAFSVLSRGANTGKLVLRLEDDAPARAPITIDADAVHLVTGGFGALGERTAQALVEAGARCVALTGRRPPPEEQLGALRERLGAEVLAIEADVSTDAGVAKVRAAIAQSGRPLGGIVHAAGVLADAPLASQHWDLFEKVFAPKVWGGWLLDRLAADMAPAGRPAYFVAYASVAAAIGATGQANYAAANAFLDALAQRRCAAGAPSLSIDWGPFAEVGMAARLDPAQIRAVEDKGFSFIAPADGMAALRELLAGGRAQALVGEVDWSKVAAASPGAQPLVQDLAAAAAGSGEAGFDVGALAGLPRAEQAARINALIRSRIAQMLQFDHADDIAPDTPFAELGLDSLVGLELVNSLEAALGVSLPNSVVLDAPSLPEMTEFILEQLAAVPAGGAAT